MKFADNTNDAGEADEKTLLISDSDDGDEADEQDVLINESDDDDDDTDEEIVRRQYSVYFFNNQFVMFAYAHATHVSTYI